LTDWGRVNPNAFGVDCGGRFLRTLKDCCEFVSFTRQILQLSQTLETRQQFGVPDGFQPPETLVGFLGNQADL
jgi:hypothetical protein